jgi:O-antigen polymerase
MFKYIKEYAVIIILFASVLVSDKFTDTYILPKQFFITLSIPVLLIIILLWKLFKKSNNLAIKLDIIDYLCGAYTVYDILNHFIVNGLQNIEQEVFVTLMIFIFYILIKQSLVSKASVLNLNFLLPLILIFPLYQSVHGIFDYFGIIENNSEYFKIVGAFGNPGAYSNFIVASLPLSFGLLVLSKKSAFKQWQKCILISTFILSIIVLSLSQARTAWICAVFGISAILVLKYGLITKFKALRFKWAIILGITALLIISSFQLYQYKKDSSLGRLFVWELSLKSISEKPLLGHGINRFKHSQNMQQAIYFKNNPEDTKNGYLADNATFAFNDYLQKGVEEGIVGLLFFLLIVFILIVNFFKTSKNKGISNKAVFFSVFISFLTILISGCFSYPLQYTPINLYFYLYIAILSFLFIERKDLVSISKVNFVIIAVIIIISSFIILNSQIRRYKANLDWNKAVTDIKSGQRQVALRKYDKIYPILRYNGNFLYNYGAELSIIGQYEHSIKILKECSLRLNDADVYTYLGNSYENLGKLNEAEQAYIQASNILPHRLYPKYRLVYVYAKANEIEKAVEMAHVVLDKKPKIESTISEKIKEDLNIFLKGVYMENDSFN